MNSKLLRREVLSEKTFLLTSNKNFAIWILLQFSNKILIWTQASETAFKYSLISFFIHL